MFILLDVPEESALSAHSLNDHLSKHQSEFNLGEIESHSFASITPIPV